MTALELKLPPVAQFLLFVAGMWLVAKYAPSLALDIPFRRALVILFFGLSAFVAIPAIAAFHSAGTTVDPRYPGKATQLIVRGIYRYSRNPMYLGLLVLLIAWAIYLSNLFAFIGPAAFVLSMNRLQIRPEEEAMEARFGDDFRRYRESVRRWI
jgi:protein-S-isoprenylcysteine O-methyltransferase Ste14